MRRATANKILAPPPGALGRVTRSIIIKFQQFGQVVERSDIEIVQISIFFIELSTKIVDRLLILTV